MMPQTAIASGLRRTDADRGLDGHRCADVAIEQQRDGDHGGGQHQHGEAETDQVAPEHQDLPCGVLNTSSTKAVSEGGEPGPKSDS